MTKKEELGPEYMIYGNKGNVWENTAHIFKSGTGNLCGTPALATNHARLQGVDVAGCKKCNEIYSSTKELI